MLSIPLLRKAFKCFCLRDAGSHVHRSTFTRHYMKEISKKSGLQPHQGDHIPFHRLIKPFLFTVGFTGCTSVGVVIWHYENIKARRKNFYNEFVSKLNRYHPKRGEIRQKIHQWWMSLSDGHKLAFGIAAVNFGVFLAWRLVPSLQKTLLAYFTCSPSKKAVCLPMFLSTFSHYNFLHLAANMYVLWSFAPAICSYLGKEEFLGLYLSAAVVSSFTSCLHKVATSRMAPSLGASGSIMAIIGAMCSTHPDSLLSIIFLPMFVFSASTALKAIIAMDTAGVVLGWSLFDHAAHLGGMLYGLWYVNYGRQYLWSHRESLVKHWQNLKEGKY